MTLNERLRQVAHQLWLDEGQPDGRADEHWRRAEELCEGLYQSDGGVNSLVVAADLTPVAMNALLARVGARLASLRDHNARIRDESQGLQALRAQLLDLRVSRKTTKPA